MYTISCIFLDKHYARPNIRLREGCCNTRSVLILILRHMFVGLCAKQFDWIAILTVTSLVPLAGRPIVANISCGARVAADFDSGGVIIVSAAATRRLH